jgi:diguanylate cyclase (GGDEF)-like protein
MTMDAFTAGIAFAVAQVCIAVVMAGVYFATRSETCTRYWALGGGLAATGILIIAANAGASNYAILALGNNLLTAGLVFEWWGLQVFAGRRPSKVGHVILVVFFLVFGAVLLSRADIAVRSAISAATVTLVYALCTHDLWQLVRRQGISAASSIGFAAAAGLIGTSVVRFGFALKGIPAYSPVTSTTLAVAVVFMIPLAGKLLFSLAQLLLYFERLVSNQRHKAMHDELTGLLNRRAFVAAGKREMALAVRQEQPLAVAYIDVDYFKSINDRYGHGTGDEVLRKVAAVLAETAREVDLVARYGGDEFCVVLPGLTHEDAQAVGNRLVDTMRRAPLHGLTVSLSIGIATAGAGIEVPWEDLLGLADETLYAAKEAGRNCCVVRSAIVVPNAELLGTCAPDRYPASINN